MNEDYYSYTKKYFRLWAPIYDYVNAFVLAVRTKVVYVTDAGEGAKILDVATGTGKQAFAFGERGYEVVGIDLSEDMLRIANRNNKYGNVRFEVGDATSLRFEENHFDVSCVSFALHDMPLSIREKVLEEIVRVTKPKGTIVIADYALPSNRVARYLIYFFVGSYESKYYPQFIGSDLKALARKCGIEIKREISVMFGSARILIATNQKKSNHQHF